MAKKKILFIANSLRSMVNFRLDVIKALCIDYEIHIIAPTEVFFKNSNDGKEIANSDVEVFKNLGINIHNICIDSKGKNPFMELKFIYNLFRNIKNINPDFMFNYTIKPVIYGSLVAKFLNISCISMITGLGYTFMDENRNSLLSKIVISLYKFTLNKNKEVWFLNSDDYDEFISSNIIKKHIAKIIYGEGVNTEFYQPDFRKLDDKIKFLFIARMIKDKGIYEYIEASKIIKEKGYVCEFGMLGACDCDNPNAVNYNELKNEENKGFITYFGTSGNSKEYILNFTCIVLPSYYREGIPMTLMEAASCAKPLIATNVPGCKEVVEDGYNGFLCRKRDASDLADKMEKLINLNKDELEIMGQNSRKLALEKFDVSRIIMIYKQALSHYL